MFYSNLAYLAITFFLIYKLLKKDFNLFHVLIFVLPIHSWFYDIGLNLTVYQIVTLVMIPTVFIASIYRKKTLFYFGNKAILVFLLYAILDTTIMSIFFIDEYMNLGSFFRSEGRFISQIALLFITFAIVPLAFNYIKNIQDAKKYIQVYLYSLIVLIVLGYVQFITYNVGGFDLFPLSINQFGDVRTGIFGYGESGIFRISSLGGEPKGFSMSLIIGFFIIHVFNHFNITFYRYDRLLKYLFLLTALATFSTSGIVLFAILFVVYFLYVVINDKYTIKGKNIFYTVISLFFVMLLTYQYWDFISLIIHQRVLERDIAHEDFDIPIQIFLSNFPEYLFFGSGLGNIHNLAYPYIPSKLITYMGDSIFFAKSGYLRLISELGLTGLVLFVLIVYSVYRNLSKANKSVNTPYSQVVKALQLLLVILLIGYFARIYIYSELILFLSIANAYGLLKSRRNL